MEFFGLIGWLLLSWAIGVWADRKNRRGFLWFLMAMIISPLITAIFLFAMGDAEDTANTWPCPQCAERIQKAAKICKHCHSELSSYSQAEKPHSR